jgi:hypothetical protein
VDTWRKVVSISWDCSLLLIHSVARLVFWYVVGTACGWELTCKMHLSNARRSGEYAGSCRVRILV